MSRFNQILHHTGERLALPKATRSLILVEIASDLEDLYEHYVNQGLSEEEAAARAEEKVNMTDEALVELVRIHSERHGWSDRIARRVQPLWERLAMSVIVLLFLVLAIAGNDLSLFRETTGFVWPIGAIMIVLVVFFLFQFTRFSDRPNPRRLRESLVTPLVLGAASVLIGFLGTGIEMYRTLMEMAAKPETAGPLFSRAVIASASTLTIGLLVALCAGVCWFILAGRVTRAEDDAAWLYTEVK